VSRPVSLPSDLPRAIRRRASRDGTSLNWQPRASDRTLRPLRTSFDHLLPVLGRIPPSALRHGSPPWLARRNGVRHSGATPDFAAFGRVRISRSGPALAMWSRPGGGGPNTELFERGHILMEQRASCLAGERPDEEPGYSVARLHRFVVG